MTHIVGLALNESRKERRAVFGVATIFAVGYALIGIFRHRHFSSGFDLAIFDQALWHVSRFALPASTLSGNPPILGDHFSPIVFLLTPLYWIRASPEMLIAAQAALLGISIVPVHRFLRTRLPSGPALTLVIAYGLFWGMQRTAWFDFHELAFAPLLVATVILAMDQKRWRLFWCAVLALTLVKEDMIPLAGAIGLYLIYQYDRRRGLALTLASGVVFVVVLRWVIPWFAHQGSWTYAEAFQTLLHSPWRLPMLLVTPAGKVATIALWLVPFALLPVFSPLAALALPVAAERLLSDLSNHWGPGFHYSAPLAPILAMAAGDGLARLVARPMSSRRRARLLVLMPAFSVVLALVLPGHQPLLRTLSPGHYQPITTARTAARALSIVPSGASVVAQTAIAPHLSQRERLYVLQPGAPDADFVIASHVLDPWPMSSVEEISLLLADRERRGYVVVFSENGWTVLKRIA
jgi:uncharacterized membrane protein